MSGPASRFGFVISFSVRLPEGDAVDGAVTGTAADVTQASGLRRHWVFAGLLVLAAALRGVVLAAYHPALIFPDSVRYLQYAHNFSTGHWSADALRQSGYSVLIIPVALLHELWLVPLAQHLAGLHRLQAPAQLQHELAAAEIAGVPLHVAHAGLRAAAGS